MTACSLDCALGLLATGVIATFQPSTGLAHAPENDRARWHRTDAYEWVGARAAQYHSPSLEFTLCVTPSDKTKTRSRGASYRFLSGRSVLWERDAAYTLEDARVTDHGYIVGFAYRYDEQWQGYFHILIINRDGKELLHEITPRRGHPFLQNAYPEPTERPYAMGLLVDAEHDRAIVRVAEPLNESQGEHLVRVWGRSVWRIYELSTGRFVGSVDEETLVDPVEGWVVDAQPVRGTPLILVHALLDTQTRRGRSARFLLVDGQGTRVWALDIADDYVDVGPIGGDFSPAPYFRAHPAILASARPAQFDLRLFADKKRVSFSVTQGAHGTWQVKEIARADYGKDVQLE